ncbi:MAG: hypothetical protein EPN93_03470 [Spirochaetes bacterium]|nr:MAG: hypothetical protein EPN93_03470 [Spirochaetota bacterium]
MKKRHFIPIAALVTIFALGGCKSNKALSFCEGVSQEGKGVKCGTVFTTGDVTAVIEIKDNFEVEKLDVKVYEQKKNKDELVETVTLNVAQDKKSANLNLSFYNEGRYRVEVRGKEGKAIAENALEVTDSY